jgi:hypothetical protein
MKHLNLLFLSLFGLITPVFGQINQANQAQGWLSGCAKLFVMRAYSFSNTIHS